MCGEIYASTIHPLQVTLPTALLAGKFMFILTAFSTVHRAFCEF